MSHILRRIRARTWRIFYFGETADGAVDGSKTKIPSATTFVLKKINPMGLKAKVKNADYADGYVTVRMTKDDGYKDIVHGHTIIQYRRHLIK